MKKMLTITITTIAVIFILTGVLFAVKLHPLERELEKRLPALVGPAKKYTVKIKDTGIMDLLSGTIKDLYMSAEQVLPKDCPQIESVKIHLSGIEFDLDKIEKITGANFIIILSQDSINNYLPEKVKEYPDLRVELKDNNITVSTSKKIYGFALPIKVAGILEAENQKRVNFRCNSLSVSGIPLPEFVRKNLEEKVNPLVDLTEMKIITNILGIKIMDNRLQVEGSASVNAPIYYGK